MQEKQEYGQSASCVKKEAMMAEAAPLRQRGNQTHRVSVRVGQERVRVSGDFGTIMGWIHLALAENTARRAA